MPDSVAVIEEKAFYSSPVKEVVFGKGLKTIRKVAFAYCRDIKKLEFSIELEQLEKLSFLECEFEQVKIGSSVQLIEPDSGIGSGADGIYYDEPYDFFNENLGDQNDFYSAYEENGKKAGVYTLTDNEWVFE